MPNFLKEEHELETLEDKWYYIFKHLDILEQMPARFKEKIFKSFFESAELANLPRPSQMEYEESLKQLRDLKNVLQTAREEERKIAKQNIYKSAKQLLALNILTVTQIAEALNISEEEVLRIKNNQL